MIGTLGFLCLGINAITLCKNRDKGIVLYCILCMTAPVATIFGISLKYEIVSLPILFYIAISRNAGKVKFNTGHIIWIMWYIWFFIITLLSPYSLLSGSKIEWISIIGFARGIIIYWVLSYEEIVRNKFISIIKYTIYINLIAVILQFILLRIYSDMFVINLLLQLYGTVGNAGALTVSANIGSLGGRYYGAFSSPSFLGTFSILGMIVFFDKWQNSRKFVDFFHFAMATVLGIATSTKRFYLGIVAVPIYYIFVKIYVKKGCIKINANWLLKSFLVVIVACVLFVVIALNFVSESTLKYYSSFLLEGKFLQSFETRFGSTGAVNSMRETIRNNLFTGVGMISVPGVNIIDSQFYATLYTSGIIGLFIMIAFWGWNFKRIRKEKSVIKFLVFGISLFEFFISTEFYSSLGIFLLSSLAAGNIISDAKVSYLYNRDIKYRFVVTAKR